MPLLEMLKKMLVAVAFMLLLVAVNLNETAPYIQVVGYTLMTIYIVINFIQAAKVENEAERSSKILHYLFVSCIFSLTILSTFRGF